MPTIPEINACCVNCHAEIAVIVLPTVIGPMAVTCLDCIWYGEDEARRRTGR